MKRTGLPTISIVIPTFNRPTKLAACLEACANLDYPRDRFDIIVVDDGGHEALQGLVARFQGRVTVGLLRQANAGPAAARNRGAAAAEGEFLAFTDDDCAPAPQWLQALATELIASPGCAVGGHTVNVLTDNLYSKASQLVVSYLFSYYNAEPQAARFFPSCNMALPAERFRAIGGFDETYPRAAAEDRDLCDRWLDYGYRMVYAAGALVCHAHDLTFRTFLRQQLQYGQGAFWFHRSRTRRGQCHLKLEPPGFYLNMLRYPFMHGQGLYASRLTALLVGAQVAIAAGFVLSAMGRKW